MQINKLLTFASATAMLLMSPVASEAAAPSGRTNPLMAEKFNTPFEIPPFEIIEVNDYLPAVEEGIKRHDQEIEAIINNPATPNFENTILALEQSGKLLKRTLAIFGHLNETNSNEEMQAVSEKIFPMESAHSDAVSMNGRLFDRVKKVYDNRDKLNLDVAQRRAVEKAYRDFVRNGALLSAADKARLSELNNQLTNLYLQFNKNLLDATNAFSIVVDDASRLSGLPASNIAVAAEEAAARGLNGKWVFTLHAPSRLPLLQSANDRDLRREMYEG